MKESCVDMTSGEPRHQVIELVRAGMVVGLEAWFLKSHSDPNTISVDGPGAPPLTQLVPFLAQLSILDDMVKSLAPLAINQTFNDDLFSTVH